MQPLIKMQPIKDESGKLIGATATTLISGKKAVMVASQGDFSPSASALLLRALDSNLKDFRLKKVAEVFSTGNLETASVKNKEADLQQAFDAGVKLVIL
jgi:peroxiredoxin